MNLSEQIRYVLKTRGLTQRWLANEMGLDEKTLSGKLNRDSITASELLQIGNLLNINLNKLKEGNLIMFDWLKGQKFEMQEGGQKFYCKVDDVDVNNKLLVKIYQNENYDVEINEKVIDILKSGISIDFTNFDNWEEKLYNKLLSENCLSFSSFYTADHNSSENGYDFSIKRIVTDNGDFTTVSYSIEAEEEIISCEFVSSSYTFYKCCESKENFVTWIKGHKKSHTLFGNENLKVINFEESQVSTEEWRTLSLL